MLMISHRSALKSYLFSYSSYFSAKGPFLFYRFIFLYFVAMSVSAVGLGDEDDPIDFDLSEYSSIYDANLSLNSCNQRDLSILYINIVSLPSNMNELLHFLSRFDKKPDIISLTETKITETNNTHFNPFLENYTFYNIRSKTHFGSIGMFIRDNLSCKLRPDFTEKGLFEMLWFEISFNERNSDKSIFGIIYRHPGLATIPTFTTRIENIIEKLNQEKVTYYILGDYNINLIKTDEIHNISNFVNTMHSLGALNLVNKPTRFPIGNQIGAPSLLDHFWTNEMSYVSKISLIIDPISDHRPMLITIKSNKRPLNTPNSTQYIRDMTNFDVQGFNESLFNFQTTSSDINDKFSELQNHISQFRKRTRKERKFSPKPWISSSIQTSINNKNSLYYYLQSHANEELKKKYNKMKKILKKVLFSAEVNYYHHKFEQCKIESRKTWGLINQITSRKKKEKPWINSLKTNNGTTEDAQEMANTLNDFFTKIGTTMSNTLPPAPCSHNTFLKNRQQSSFFLSPTDPFEILEIINKFSSRKAAGYDKIPAKFLKIGSPALSNILSNLVNDCFSQGIFPNTLKIARVTPIHKGGAKDTPSNYRPISILYVISKLIEKLTYNRLIKYINKKSILNSSQFGFRSAHSTIHAITAIHERILENVNNDKHTISIYLDLSKAFDSVNHEILLNKLEHYGIRGAALNFFKSYLSDRQQLTMVNGEMSQLLTVICGVPQGSTLGPLLFLLYINDLAESSNFFTSLFADDTGLLLSHKNIYTLVELCNVELIKINRWFLANRLTANFSKASKYMVTFGKKRQSFPTSLNIIMGDTILERVRSIKYLGVIFDENFRWHEHVAYLSKKLSCSTGVLSKLRYYTDIKTLLQVYDSLIGSRLNYGLIVWGAACKTILQPLRVLQNRAIRLISRAPRFRRLDNDYLNLRLLKLDDMYHLSLYKFMHQNYHSKLPSYFSDFFTPRPQPRTMTRSTSSIGLQPICCRKKIMERSIRYVGPKLWQTVSSDNFELSNKLFKKLCTNLLLAEY